MKHTGNGPIPLHISRRACEDDLAALDYVQPVGEIGHVVQDLTRRSALAWPILLGSRRCRRRSRGTMAGDSPAVGSSSSSSFGSSASARAIDTILRSLPAAAGRRAAR